MKVSYAWLRELVDLQVPPAELAATMSVRGFAVEGLEALPNGDTVLDFEVTANRPDCMSVRGLAREVATAFALPWRDPVAATPLPPAAAPGVTIDIERPDLCSRYAGALATVKVAASPEWLQTRLRSSGVRPINNIVDVTNYVLLELGQPMHAFDVQTLAGPAIRVRAARPGESIRTLDGQDRRLAPEMLVIADRDRPAAVAGVMGGAETEVSSATTRILFESAHFNPLSVRRTSKALGLKTEASMRFERGTDPALPALALARACELLERIGAGRADGHALDCHPTPLTARVIRLRRAKLDNLLGFTVPGADVTRVLQALGFTLRTTADGWDVEVPTARVDVVREVDVIEEVARHHGFEKIPATFPALRAAPPASDPRVEQARHLRTVMTGAGFYEAMTFGFIAEAAAAPFAPPGDVVAIANPLSETFAVLRPSLLPGLLDGVAHNRRREQADVRLFEIGARFAHATGENRALAFALTGSSMAQHWSQGAVPASLFDATGVVERVCRAVGVDVAIERGDAPWLVAGQSAIVRSAGGVIGTVGRVLPALAEARGIPRDDTVYVAELDLDAATAHARRARRVVPLPRFPSVSRDLALLVDDTLPAAVLRQTIRAAAPPTLAQVREFDRYQGKGISDGKVSLAVRMTFRSPERTLTDAEVQAAMDAILDAVRTLHGAVQR